MGAQARAGTPLRTSPLPPPPPPHRSLGARELLAACAPTSQPGSPLTAFPCHIAPHSRRSFGEAAPELLAAYRMPPLIPHVLLTSPAALPRRSFGETAPELLAAYRVPPLFAHDLFAALRYARDEYRWLVAGPPRSGASWHVDPAATSAWNTSLVGEWVVCVCLPHRTKPPYKLFRVNPKPLP